MSVVVFMRGVNVGRHKRFQPSLLVRELAHLAVVNVGAAGTFVIPGRVAEKAVRAEFGRRLPFEADLMICRGRDLVALAAGGWSEDVPERGDLRRVLTVMAAPPARPPRLPYDVPAGRDWQVRIVALEGRFALSLWRRVGRLFTEPNTVVEKTLGVRATTRNWNTIEKVCRVLADSGASRPTTPPRA